jgi:hypothetical protein
MTILALVLAVIALVIAIASAKCAANTALAMAPLEKRIGVLEVKRRASRREEPAKPVKPVNWEE